VQWKKILFSILALACCLPLVGTPVALATGILFSLVLGNPWPQKSAAWSRKLLQSSVVGLGFGLSLGQIWEAGREAIFITIIGICLTVWLGTLLGRWFGTEQNTSMLISFGTAICGGSAIAAMAPVVKARDEETAVAVATVFTLNAAALLLFPGIGHLLHMSQSDFGMWSALAIHDTSSVVGAAAAFGAQALAIGTTVKLARAAWIMPCVMFFSWRNKSEGKARLPWFIPGFLLAATLRSVLPDMIPLWDMLNGIAKQALVVTLFLIGSGLTRQVLQRVGARPFAQGIALWLIVSVGSLVIIHFGWIG